jgi:hypothetical protein
MGVARNRLARVVLDDVMHAIRISAHGWALLCAAAGIAPPKYEGREWAEPDVQDQTQSLTGRPLSSIIAEGDIISRRPYRCASCGGTFTIEEFHRLRDLARRADALRPFDSVEPVHESCSAH